MGSLELDQKSFGLWRIAPPINQSVNQSISLLRTR